MDDLAGREIKGYELRQLIGRGGFGVVYRAFQDAVQRDVAIKIIHPQYANKPNFIRNFQYEARLIARLEHLHIVPLYDFWRDPEGAYIVMRWLRGGSLSRLVKKQGPVDIETAANILDQIASALQIAHNNDIIHQDMKTANILLDDDMNAYLTDFGIARDLSTASELEVNHVDVVHGSPEYMAPEQIFNIAVDHRSDIYGLGIVLYEMLTGVPPFRSDDDQKVLHNQLYDKLPPLQELKPDLPEKLNEVIWKATDKHPKRRYQSTLEMAASFRKALQEDEPSRAAEVVVETIIADPAKLEELLHEPSNPYKGLQPFQESDTENFFGRGELVTRLLDRLREGGADGRFLAVVGPSGIGKSSVVKAGVIPALRKGELAGSENWFITEMAPSNAPLDQLTASLNQIAAVGGIPIHSLLDRGGIGMLAVLDKILSETAQVVLVIDQFEELFTLTPEDERRKFLDLIMTALESDRRKLIVIVTLRADFYDRPLMYPEFGELLRRRTEIVLPLNRVQLREVIESPARNVGLDFEDGLVDEIVAEVSEQPSALPLLQYALHELFTNRRGRTLKRETYETMGGVSGAMTKRADELLQQLSHDSQRMARQMFLRLVALGEGTEDTRRRARRVELLSVGDTERMIGVIELFGKYRLLTFDNESESRAPTVEIAHEALIRNWLRLREWLDDNRDYLRLQRHLATAVSAWSGSGQDRSFLATGGRLAQLEVLLSERADLALTDTERQFLEASHQLQERNKLLARVFLAFLLVIAVVFAGLALFALRSQQRAEDARDNLVVAQQTTVAERDISRARELAITALSRAGSELDLSLLLGLQARNYADIFTTQDTLLKLLLEQPRLDRYLYGNTDFVRTLVYSPDGSLIVSGGQDNSIRFWDSQTGQALGDPLFVHSGWVNSIRFSPDGSLIVSGGQDKHLFVIDVASHETIDELTLPDKILGVDFAPSGTQLAVASEDDMVYLVDVATMSIIGDGLAGHENTVYAIAFSPRGDLLVSADGDGKLIFWDLAQDPASPQMVAAGDSAIRALDFNDSGTLLASGDEDGVVRLWNARSHAPFGEPFVQHVGGVRAISFDSTSANFFTASIDGTIFEWDPNNRVRPVDAFTNLQLLATERPAILAMSLDPASQKIAAAGHDSRVTLWKRSNDSQLDKAFIAYEDSVVALGFTDTGELLSIANDTNAEVDSNQLIHWDMSETPEQLRAISLEQQIPRLIPVIEISPDGKLVAEGGEWVDVYDTGSGELLASLVDEPDVLMSLGFGAENRLLAAGSRSNKLTIWERADSGDWTQVGDSIVAHDDRILSLAVNPVKMEIATGSRDGAIKIWRLNEETRTFQLAVTYDAANEVLSMVYNDDGSLLAVGDTKGAVRLIDLVTGLDRSAQFHLNHVNDLVFVSGDARLASVSRDGTAILWDTSNEQLRVIGAPLVRFRSTVPLLSATTDSVGGQLFVGDEEGNIINWAIDPVRWSEIACHITNRELTLAEVNMFFPGVPVDNLDLCPDP